MERVVITGLGVVSCIGNNTGDFWDALLAGRSGIAPIQAFDPEALTTRIAGEVKNFAFDPRQGKRMARFTQFAVSAATEALGQAGLVNGEGKLSHANPERIGASIGSGIGGFDFLVDQHQKFMEKGPGKFHPLTVPIVISNMAVANVAIQFGLLGPNHCISTACASANHSIGAAFDTIRAGRADVMVAGGSESTITPFAVDGYIQLRALSTRNEDPTGASRPFSAGGS